MRTPVDELATGAGLDESESAEALTTVQEAFASRSCVHAEELVFRLASRLGISWGRAVEVAQMTCHAIARSLDAEARRVLLSRLSADVRELFEPPASAAAPGAHSPRMPGIGRTLAAGRPGSEHGLAVSRPGSSHPLSENRPPRRGAG